jgi:hypothetical protein
MSLLDTASLIVTPNGYKEGKLYSVIPSDGSGDMSVTRATTATRVNSAGLVELVPYNLLQYSQDFTNAAWTKVNATITANSTTAPDGTLTANKFESNSAGVPQLSQSISGTNTISIYAKAGNFSNFRIWIGSEVIFDLSNGSVISGTATIEDAGNGWYRCIISSTNAGAFNPYFVATASGQFVYVWGAQMVEGSTAKDYQKTETRLNIPRLDYSNGTCPSLLVEPQRTNILPYSSSFDNAAWGKDNNGSGTLPIVTANYATSPDGTMSADRAQLANIGGSGNSANYSLIGQYPLSLGSTGTATIWLKSNTSLNQNVLCYWGGGQGDVFEVTPTWQRFTLSNLSASGLSNLAFGTRGGSGSFFNGGDEVLDILVWGAQLEVGNYSTSYIPTTSASVTRNADVISKTGISSLIGQTEGVAFYDGYYGNNADEVYLFLQASASSGVDNSIYLQKHPGGQIRFIVVSGSTQIVFINGGNYSIGDRIKIAAAYKANDFVLYINGTQIGTDTSGTPPTCANVQLASYAGSPTTETFISEGGTNAVAFWPTRLTNTQLAQLTTI